MNSNLKRGIRVLLFLTLTVALIAPFTRSAPLPAHGQSAQLFALKDLDGQTCDLAACKDAPLTILYFFDPAVSATQEGLLTLNELARQHRAELRVWAITAAARNQAVDFSRKSALVFPVLAEGGTASALYGATRELPVVCLIGPKLKILDLFRGAGATTQALLRVAERELQGRSPGVAKAIVQVVARQDPHGVQAGTVRGYASLREGNLQEAEEIFRDLIKRGAQGDVPGKEGLAAVYAGRREYGKAMELIHEVQQTAPERGVADVLEARILSVRERHEEAQAALRKAVAKKPAEPYLAALPYNLLGQSYSRQGEQEKARELFEKAEAIDPYYVEGTTNKGISYEKQGKWDLALQSYREALELDKGDPYAQVLAKRAQQMIEQRDRDSERGKRMERLVQELAARYKNRQKEGAPAQDTWTSRPMVLTFLDFEDKGGLPERAGFSTVFLSDLAQRLNDSGRVTVVERALMERLLEELNLGSSQLADRDTALQIGKLLAAKLIGTGSIFYLPQQNLLTVRLIDVETSEIPRVFTKELGPQLSLDAALAELNREILSTVIAKYPVRGYVVKVDGGQALLNVGARQGVVAGTRFDVLAEGEAVSYKGKTLRLESQVVGELEVVRVEPDVAYARLVSQQRAIRPDDKVQGARDEAGRGGN